MKALKIIGAVVLGIIVLVAVSQCGKAPASPGQSSSTIGTGAGAVQAVAPSAPAPDPVKTGPATSISEGGTYHVGEDIVAGSWKTTGPPPGAVMDMCVWQRAKDDSGEIKSVITSGIINGPTSVTVKSGEYLVLTGECTWAKK